MKKIKIAYIIIIIFISWWMNYLNIINKYIYKNEIEYIKKFLFFLSKKDISEIKKRAFANSYFLKSEEYLSESSELLKHINISMFDINSIIIKDNELFIQIYFENDKTLYMNFILQKLGNKYFVRSFSFSDMFPFPIDRKEKSEKVQNDRNYGCP